MFGPTTGYFFFFYFFYFLNINKDYIIFLWNKELTKKKK
jgi:hypothetical protein